MEQEIKKFQVLIDIELMVEKEGLKGKVFQDKSFLNSTVLQEICFALTDQLETLESLKDDKVLEICNENEEEMYQLFNTDIDNVDDEVYNEFISIKDVNVVVDSIKLVDEIDAEYEEIG